MENMEKIRMTEAERASLQAKLDECLARREVIKKEISTARGFGDLSENSEYDEAKNEQAKNEAKILELEEKLRHAEIVDESAIDHTVVNIGSSVKVFNKKTGVERVYNLVGTDSVDPKNGKISELSPIGRALIGSRVGDNVVAETPNGNMTLEILSIERAKG